jgi:predicted dehydrogenase
MSDTPETPNEGTLRVIQVGTGGFGRSWAGIARATDGVELVAVADPAPAARQWATDTLGLPASRVVPDLDAALAAVDCDAVLVITPPATHHAVVTGALQAGKHVLVEKPLATTVADARDLIAAAERAGRMLVVSQNYRFRNPARSVQKAIAGGELGELLAVDIAFRRDTRTLFGEGNFRYSMEHPTVLDMTIHHLDLLRAVTGRNPARIDARSWRVPDSPYRHDPAVAALIDLDGGVPVAYRGDWATHEPETSWNGDWVITGEKGRLVWVSDVANPMIGTARFAPWAGEPRDLPPADLPAEDRRGSLLAFREAVLTGEPAETRAEDNLWSLAAVTACVASIESGAPVELATLVDGAG